LTGDLRTKIISQSPALHYSSTPSLPDATPHLVFLEKSWAGGMPAQRV